MFSVFWVLCFWIRFLDSILTCAPICFITLFSYPDMLMCFLFLLDTFQVSVLQYIVSLFFLFSISDFTQQWSSNPAAWCSLKPVYLFSCSVCSNCVPTISIPSLEITTFIILFLIAPTLDKTLLPCLAHVISFYVDHNNLLLPIQIPLLPGGSDSWQWHREGNIAFDS